MPALHILHSRILCLLSPHRRKRRPYLTNYTMNINCSPKLKIYDNSLDVQLFWSCTHGKFTATRAIRSIQWRKKNKYMTQFPSVRLKFIKNSILSPSAVRLNPWSIVCIDAKCRLNEISLRWNKCFDISWTQLECCWMVMAHKVNECVQNSKNQEKRDLPPINRRRQTGSHQ